MSFYTLNELQIKLLDFTTLLSPLGVVKKIVSNGNTHLFEIFFHNKVQNIKGSIKPVKDSNFISSNLIKLFYDDNYGFIVNETSCILEIPNNLFLEDKNSDLKKLAKGVRKLIPKVSSDILNNGFNLKTRKITNPESINILNFDGFHTVSV